MRSYTSSIVFLLPEVLWFYQNCYEFTTAQLKGLVFAVATLEDFVRPSVPHVCCSCALFFLCTTTLINCSNKQLSMWHKWWHLSRVVKRCTAQTMSPRPESFYHSSIFACVHDFSIHCPTEFAKKVWIMLGSYHFLLLRVAGSFVSSW